MYSSKNNDLYNIFDSFPNRNDEYEKLLYELGVSMYDSKGRLKTLIDIFDDIGNIMYS